MLWQLLTLASLLLFKTPLAAQAQVTYGLSKGRLGDQLVSYLHAKWISYRYHLPLVYTPFPHSDAFLLHERETRKNRQQRPVTLTDLSILETPENKLYLIPYAPECVHDYDFFPSIYQQEHPYIQVDWEDKPFIEWVRPFVSPRLPIQLIDLPKDKITVAVHIRTLTGADARIPNLLVYFPYKFLPDTFYIDQIRWTYENMGRKPLYVFLFSNDPLIKTIAERYKSALNIPDITFDYRKGKEDLLSDLFSMMHFDVLIRSESNLSIVADKLGFQKIVISPQHVEINLAGENVVDEVKITHK